MKILLAGSFSTEIYDKFCKLLPNDEIYAVKSQQEYDCYENCNLIIVRVLKTPKETLHTKKDLKAIIRWGAGYDSVDIESAGKRGIVVANTPGVNAYAVSELAIGLMIAVGRHITVHNQLTHNGLWNNGLHAACMSTLNHKTIGIIGGGNIGQRVAQQVQAFGANVLYYDMFRLPKDVEERCGMTYSPLRDLLVQSDVLSLHAPLSDATHHMIGKKELAMMKPTAILINTARGGLIDDAELASALAAGKIAGAGLDCVENEHVPDGPFAALENVLITPHIGGTSNDLADEMIPVIVSQVKKFAETNELDHIVNRLFLNKNTI